MWVSRAVKEWFHISRQAYEDLKVKNAALEAELTALRYEKQRADLHFDWLRMKVNELELMNKALIQQAYGIALPAPELTRQAPVADPLQHFSFDDVGDEVAKKLGLNIFDSRTDD